MVKVLRNIAIIILIVSSLRFLFLLLLGINSTNVINFSSTIILFSLVIYFSNPIGLIFSNNKKLFENVLLLNFYAGIFWLIMSFIINGYSLTAVREFLILFVSPLSIFIFNKTSESTLYNLISIIVLVISVSCLLDFFISNIFPAGIIGAEIKNFYLAKITPPQTEISPARIGLLVRAHGITGSYHDSANILTFSLIYLIGDIFAKKKYKLLKLFVVLIGFFALVTTLSLANIIAFFVGLFIINFYSIRNLIPRTIFSCSFIFLILLFFENNFNFSKYILPQLDPSGVKFQAMLNTGSSSLFENLITLTFGHERLTQISNIGYFSESAFVVLFTNLGLIPFFSFMALVLLPLYNYIISDSKELIFFKTVSVFVAVLTLWHYGSLLRSTSIFIFYAIYSLSIRNSMIINYDRK